MWYYVQMFALKLFDFFFVFAADLSLVLSFPAFLFSFFTKFKQPAADLSKYK